MDPVVDDFALFGLARRFALDELDIDARWRALQALVHPDRLVGEEDSARAQGLQWSLRVNEARVRLKNPLLRAELLCRLLGAPSVDRSATPAPAILLRHMDWRQTLESAADVGAIQALADAVAAHERELLEALRDALDVRADPQAARQPLLALAFARRLREAIDARLEAAAG